MAGIGFVLRKISQQNNLIGLAQAHVNATILATGPWLFTIVAFWIINMSVASYMAPDQIMRFMIVVIYNFSFSSVFCGAITLVSTRYIADCIFSRKTDPVPSLLVETVCFTLLVQAPLAIWFYFGVLSMSYQLAWLSVANYLIISLIWLTSVYLTAVKNYHAVTIAFGTGMVVAIISIYWLGYYYRIPGMMLGLNLGLGCCLALILANILSEYPYPFKWTADILGYIKRFWLLIMSGLVYNLAIWVDKWIMWFAPDSLVTEAGFRANLSYDSAMFMAYLMIIPALGVFIFTLETTFHEKYLIFYNDINNKANYDRIEHNQLVMVDTLKHSFIHFVAFQGVLTVIIVLLAPKLIMTLDTSLLRLGIFRLGVIGVFFHMMVLFLTIVLSYFDCKKSILIIQLVFLILNASLTYVTMKTDFVYYGLGYMLAAMITFSLAAVITISHLKVLPYATFITNNSSIK